MKRLNKLSITHVVDFVKSTFTNVANLNMQTRTHLLSEREREELSLVVSQRFSIGKYLKWANYVWIFIKHYFLFSMFCVFVKMFVRNVQKMQKCRIHAILYSNSSCSHDYLYHILPTTTTHRVDIFTKCDVFEFDLNWLNFRCALNKWENVIRCCIWCWNYQVVWQAWIVLVIELKRATNSIDYILFIRYLFVSIDVLQIDELLPDSP